MLKAIGIGVGPTGKTIEFVGVAPAGKRRAIDSFEHVAFSVVRAASLSSLERYWPPTVRFVRPPQRLR